MNISGQHSNGSCQNLAAPAFTFLVQELQRPFPKGSLDVATLSERVREVNSVNDTTLCHLSSVLKNGLDTLNFRVQR